MKILSVIGPSGSGKTTAIENIIKELIKRRYSVGSIKEIHYEQFAIDTPGTNTHRHFEAGSQLICARGLKETDILFKSRLDVAKILEFYDHDYVIMEGVTDFCAPTIITAHEESEIDERFNGTVFMISGKISEKISDRELDSRMIPAINCITDVSAAVDLIEAKSCRKMHNYSQKCCGRCGYSCRGLLEKILIGEKTINDCVFAKTDLLTLKINGKKIDMVPFVQKILKKTIEGMVSELDGYKKNAIIEITTDCQK